MRGVLRVDTAGEDEHTVKYVKGALVILIALFCVFVLITRPQEAANFVTAIFTGIAAVVDAIMTFFQSLSS